MLKWPILLNTVILECKFWLAVKTAINFTMEHWYFKYSRRVSIEFTIWLFLQFTSFVDVIDGLLWFYYSKFIAEFQLYCLFLSVYLLEVDSDFPDLCQEVGKKYKHDKAWLNIINAVNHPAITFMTCDPNWNRYSESSHSLLWSNTNMAWNLIINIECLTSESWDPGGRSRNKRTKQSMLIKCR